jgi:hypothetical protein
VTGFQTCDLPIFYYFLFITLLKHLKKLSTTLVLYCTGHKKMFVTNQQNFKNGFIYYLHNYFINPAFWLNYLH